MTATATAPSPSTATPAPIPGLNSFTCSDAFAALAKLPSNCVDCTATSVPYYQQRSYLPEGHPLKTFEMGLEATVEKYVADLADLFAQVLRVTKAGGSLWLNVADKVMTGDLKAASPGHREGESLGIPWRLAEAIRLKGWFFNPEVIWVKPNPMTGHRRTFVIAHEYLFHFSKGKPYFDRLAISEERITKKSKGKGNPPESVGQTVAPRSAWSIPVAGFNGPKLLADFKEDGKYLEQDPACPVHGDNPTVSAGPLFGPIDPDVACSCTRVLDDHFAVMPAAMAERCILASTSDVGNCPSCGKPWERLVEADRVATRPGTGHNPDPAGYSNRDPQRHVSQRRTIGWERQCKCKPLLKPVPPVILDPFSGAGTTAVVAEACGRDWVAIDLNPVNVRKIGPARMKAGYIRTFAR